VTELDVPIYNGIFSDIHPLHPVPNFPVMLNVA